MTVNVGVAVVTCRGKVLVGIRPPGSTLAGFAEFPGGKAHEGEDTASCAERECWEETGLRVQAVRKLYSCRLETPEEKEEAGEIHFWLCRLVKQQERFPKPTRPFRWLPLEQLAQEQFPEANQPVLQMLQNGL